MLTCTLWDPLQLFESLPLSFGSYNTKAIHIHADRRRKKRTGANIKPEYRLELQKVNAADLVKIVDEKIAPKMAQAGVKTMILDNDRKAHTAAVVNAWKKHGIDVWPGAGVVGDRKNIPDFTGKSVDAQGGFPVNSPDCMPWDYTLNSSYKSGSIKNGLYAKFKKRKPSRQTMGGFYNDMISSFEELDQDTIRNAIDAQPKIMEAIRKAGGGPTVYMSTNCKV